MVDKTRLVKKGEAEKFLSKNSIKPTTEKRERAKLTCKAIHTTKVWMANHRQKQRGARQTFASLFITPEPI